MADVILRDGTSMSIEDLQEYVKDIENARQYISCRIFNENDTEHLKDYVLRKRIDNTDLMYTFVLAFENASLPIGQYLLNTWKRDMADMLICWHHVAMYGKPDYCIMPMGNMLQELDVDADMEEIYIQECPLIVVTNKNKMFGAGEIMLYEVREKLLNMYPDGIWIFPSSVHELLVKPIQPDDNIDYLLNMVREINANEVAPEDRLSNNIYQMYEVDTLIRIGEMPL